MTTYSTMAIADLLDAFASSDPLPGGGSAAALTGSVGVSLLLMVSGMTKTRAGAPEETVDLAAAAARLRPIRDQLTALIDDDSRAYRGVIAAYRLPTATEAEREGRRDAIESALRAAIEAPLNTMRASERALRDAPLVLRHGNPNASIDAAVGTRLLLAALEGAGLNVETNLPGIKDTAYAAAAHREREALLASARALASQIEKPG